MNNDIRWKQRFQNLENAYAVFLRRIDEYEEFPGKEAYQMALIQGFEIVFELSWKTVKDYLENEGYDDVETSKKVIRRAFSAQLISEAEIWMKALELRNGTSHIYNAEVLQETTGFIHNDFYPALRTLFVKLKGYRDSER